jgi:preprotein translocase subunit SecA
VKDHLYSLDHLKEGIGLRGYGQRDPLVEYKKESFQLFQAMKERVDEEIVRYLWWLRPVLEPTARRLPRRGGQAPRRAPLILNDPSAELRDASSTAPRERRPPNRRARSVRRTTNSRRASAATMRQ